MKVFDTKCWDVLQEEDIDPELKGSMPEVSDDVFDDEGASCMDAVDIPSPEDGTDNHTPDSLINS